MAREADQKVAEDAAPARNCLPGWSLAAEGPRPKKKQGWECPAPSVQDWEDYKNWKAGQALKEELPPATQMFLADSSLLFHKDPDVQLPWVYRLKAELPRRVGRLSGDLPTKASHICIASDDAEEKYEVFKKAMAQIGVVLCRRIRNPPDRFELAHLEQSDLIYVEGGDRRRLWEGLSRDISSQIVEHVTWRYLQGALIVAAGEAMSLLGEKSWYKLNDSVVPFTGWKIFPHIVVPEAEDEDLEDMVTKLGGAGVVIFGIHPGCGMIFNKDGLVEPVKGMVQEYRWDWKSESVKEALLIGPPRGTGLICPLYAAAQRQEGDEDEAGAFAYALTQEEEQDEEHLVEAFEQHGAWLPPDVKAAVEELKAEGNEAFKAGKADLAGIKYEQALHLLESGSRKWSELEADVREALDGLAHAPEKQAAQDAQRKEDHRASALLLPVLLNQSACYLLAHEEDQQRKSALSAGGEAATAAGGNVNAGAGAEEGTLVVVRDNLVAAFRAANEALHITGGQAAKAWFRRACAFEKMRDPRNALRDLEEALLRAPEDKAIARKRDQVKEAAEKVAESMYYARHKELDAQEARLGLPARRALLLRGAHGVDAYQDQKAQFAVAQPLARCVDGTLEEVDGRHNLVLPTPPGPLPDAPYLHAHALWTWEFLVQRAPSLQLLQVENVDLGSGPLEWLCKCLRSHPEIKTLRLRGAHVGPAGAKMVRNVLAQNTSLVEVALDACGLLDAGLQELAEGLASSTGPLEVLSLRGNSITSKKLNKLSDALCGEDTVCGLGELDLSENPLGIAGAKEMARIIKSTELKLNKIALQDCALDFAAFWRLVGSLNDSLPLSRLDLRNNPIGRGTRRCWRGTMGPTIRCEVSLSDHPLKARKERQQEHEKDDTAWFPLPSRWF